MRSIESIKTPAYEHEPRVDPGRAAKEASPPRLVFSRMYDVLHALRRRAAQPSRLGQRDRTPRCHWHHPILICGKKLMKVLRRWFIYRRLATELNGAPDSSLLELGICRTAILEFAWRCTRVEVHRDA
jgi:hypothetical protein